MDADDPPSERLLSGTPVAPAAPSPEAEAFYVESLRELARLGVPFLLAGTYAFAAHTGISRPTKDLDIFCKAGDLGRILGHFRDRGDRIEIEDERWIGKVHRGPHFFDVIFASGHGAMPVTDAWFEHAGRIVAFGTELRIAGPTELICSKAFIQLRHRYDGPDIMHLILRQHAAIDWRRLLATLENHWEVLLAHLVNFRWIYPTERDCIPRWLMDELTARLQRQLDLPPPMVRICRGRMYSHIDYEPDISDWGFGDAGGEGGRRDG